MAGREFCLRKVTELAVSLKRGLVLLLLYWILVSSISLIAKRAGVDREQG